MYDDSMIFKNTVAAHVNRSSAGREGDFHSGTGAVRSADADELDFTSIPWIGVIGVARTAREGGTKYGQFNYMKGFSVLNLLNHSLRHVAMFILGDRSEPHLEHAAWGLLAAIQSYALTPELSIHQLLGPGATLTKEMRDYMAAQEPALAALRKADKEKPAEAQVGAWTLSELPEIRTLLAQRVPPGEPEIRVPCNGFADSF